ncbi:hypothetical protein [Nocardioides sp. KR10-350]|uniref:hypothetical protein n=1 Tax=Nocardioides cheoyonin TaxID=3156615 RepID=UPI0032B31A28
MLHVPAAVAALLLLAGSAGATSVAQADARTGSAHVVARADATDHASLEWACLSLHRGQEHTVRIPGRVVDALVERTPSYRGPCAEYGETAHLGDGTLTAYSQRVGDRPVAIGVVMSDGVLDDLPYDPPNAGLYCYDKDGDGTVDRMHECSGGYESQLDLSRSFREHADSPFTYALVNWNPFGHIPVGVYDVAHFDMHFYTGEDADRLAIRPGPCGALVDCDDYKLGKHLPDAKYIAPGFVDLDAVEPAMGNHLIDPDGPEFHGQPFTHTWIYGTWDGKVTFDEAMVTLKWYDGLRDGTTADACFDIPQPSAWQKSGWYPTSYCLRHRDNRHEVVTSLEDFVHRTAS